LADLYAQKSRFTIHQASPTSTVNSVAKSSAIVTARWFMETPFDQFAHKNPANCRLSAIITIAQAVIMHND
jgi:hypothetical protein